MKRFFRVWLPCSFLAIEAGDEAALEDAPHTSRGAAARVRRNVGLRSRRSYVTGSVKGVGAPRGAGHLYRLTPAVLELPLDPLEFHRRSTLADVACLASAGYDTPLNAWISTSSSRRNRCILLWFRPAHTNQVAWRRGLEQFVEPLDEVQCADAGGGKGARDR